MRHRAADLTGLKFGRLTAETTEVNDKGVRFWHCQCECGNRATVRHAALVDDRTKSCGCYYRDSRWTHGLTKSRTYKSWLSMKARCTDPGNRSYYRYGARGITVCERWLASFDAFLADLGVRPNGMTLDRIDPTKGYEPVNCRWATYAEQNQHRSSNKLTPELVQEIRRRWEAGDKGKDIASDLGISKGTVSVVVNRVTWRNVA